MKKFISILLTVSMIFAPLTALAEKPDIILTEEYSTDFSYDVSNANLPSIDIAEEVPQEAQVMRNAQENAVNYTEYTGTVLPEILADEGAIDISREDTEASDGIVGRTASQSPVLRSASAAGDTQYRLNNINGKDSFALQNQAGRTSFVGDDIGEEYIDPLTGNLIVTETDLVLPGVDGLDLRLERYYSLAEAELYTKTSKLNNDAITFTMSEDSYVVVESVYDRETGQTSEYRYPYAQRSEAELRKEEIESRDTNNGNFIYNATIRDCNEGDEVYVPYYYTSEITSSSYQRTRNNLGAGWSWGFPSVQIIKNNYEDATEIPKGLYYHDGKGNVIEVEYNGNGEYSFANHIGKDIIFEDYFDYDSDISSSGRIDYIVTDADSKKYYFGTRGELLTILDRFGNKITFNYTNKNFYGANNSPLISSITDSVGRKVKFTYSDPGDYETLTLTITSTMETGKELTLSYEKKMVEVLQDGETLSTEPVLVSVTNTMGETTSYYPMAEGNERKYAYPVEFTFADKKLDSGFVINTSGARNNLVYLLGNIVRPHSDTYYEYDLTTRNLGHSGVSEAYRISERGDYEFTINNNNRLDETYLKNRIQYRYTNDYTGYPRNCSITSAEEGKKVCGTREIHSKSQVSRDYYKTDGAALLKYTYETYTEPEGSQLSRNSEVVGYLLKRPVRTKITYSNNSEYSYDSYVQNEFETGQNRAFGRPTLTTAEVDYDTVIGTNRKKYATAYTYDETTGFATSKSWYRDENTKCTEYYRYNSDQRLQEVTQADGTTTNYSYEYAQNGKISKKITTVTNGTMSTVTEENYTSATGYAYPTTVKRTVTGKNISGEDISQTQTVTYTYNMLLGTIASETDNNGNTTYYEYDELARPIRIVYPKYSAYSNVNEKDLSILPVKNISYRNVIHTDYAGITDAMLRLIVQEVQTTDKYYDVSDISANNPSDDALAECSLYYIGDEIDYYTGTGELIEENTFDKIGTNYTYLKTSYIYDTVNNVKTTIDPDENTTKVYFDDLGRTVKTVDIFDNYHITEYNKNSDTAGFSAMSYFVPADDRTAKQDITECKYDRLQRVISEKAYDSYPESYSEVQYVYDIAENIIGTTDAKGNIGSSGYTVSCTYDKMNRVITSKNANDEVIKNSYDIFGNVTKQTITSASGEESILYRREYDGEGKLLSDTDNAENSNIYTYNALGQLEAVKDKNGQFLHAEFNEDGVQDRNYITRIGTAISDEQYQYITPFGASMTIKAYARYNSETDKYTGSLSEMRYVDYSPTGKILNDSSKYFYATGVENVFFYPEAEYIYDEIGNVTSAEYSCIDEVNEKKYTLANYYEYDKNRISRVQVTQGERNTADSANASYEFYPDGKLKSVTYPPLSDGTVLKSEYTYDGLSRLKTLQNTKGSTVLSGYSYEYDKNNNIISINEMVGNQQNSTSFTYDKLNRIASVSGDKGVDSYYEYNCRGNRKANFEQIDFLAEENAAYSYDLDNNLSAAQVGEELSRFGYSASGYRFVKRENSDMPTYCIYDQNGRLTAEAELVWATIDSEQKIVMYPTHQYIWGPDRVLVHIDFLAGQSYYYLYNGHGDVVQVVDTAGNVKNSYDYDVWGNFIKKEETVYNPFTYFGQTYDETTGLYYLRARYYDPTTGRFTQQDPAEDGYNWYVYGNQNPVIYTDENGENAITSAMAIPWVRQQVIWENGVRVLNLADLPVSAQMLDHSIRWIHATDVNINEDGISGSDRINKDTVINMLKGSSKINNEIDWLTKCYGKDNKNHFTWTGVLGLNDSTDSYLSFNNTTISLVGNRNKTGKWSVNVNVFDVYDFDREKINSINSLKTAIGSAAGTYAWMEQTPLLGAIKTYSINVNFNVTR